MIFTLSDARTFLRPFVDGGTCNDSKIDSWINQSTMILLQEANWKHTVRRVRFWTCGNCLTLPLGFETIISVAIDGCPSYVFDRYYEFLDGGPGVLDGCSNVCSKDLAEINRSPIHKDIHHDYQPLKVFAMVTETADESLSIVARGIDDGNEEIIVDGSPEITIPVNRWSVGVEGSMPPFSRLSMTDVEFKDIRSVIKAASTGYVTLYAYNPNYTEGEDGDPALFFLAKYHPDETQPNYKRYKIAGHSCCGDCITAIVKIGYVPVKRENDPLQIQSLIALKYMCQAINFFNQERPDMGLQYQSLALLNLDKQKKNDDPASSPLNVQGDTFGFDSLCTII